MNKQLTTERTYQIVQFEPYHVTSSLSDIPENVSLDTEAMSNLIRIQNLELELAFADYAEIVLQKTKIVDAETATIAKQRLSQLRSETYLNLVERLKSLNANNLE